jgi:hypothetical protein
MAIWKEYVKHNSLDWLLEEDAEQPGVRYFTLCELKPARCQKSCPRNIRRATG